MTTKPRVRADRTGLDAGPLQPFIDSFALHLSAEHKSPRTQRTYLEAARWIAAAHLLPAGITDWDDVTRQDIQRWMAWLNGTYSASYASNQFRALQQFFRWRSAEDEDRPAPAAQPIFGPNEHSSIGMNATTATSRDFRPTTATIKKSVAARL